MPPKQDDVCPIAKEALSKYSIGFIGAGMMASALMDGLVASKVVSSAGNISCADPWQPCRAAATEKGMFASSSNDDVIERAKDVIIIAVKPNIVPAACVDIAAIKSDALVISVAAGVTIKTLEELMPGRRVVRIMPNTPCLVGEAASGFSLGSHANDHDREIVKQIFGAVGVAMEVTEPMLDAVTGLSGSGPAYVFQFIEALADGGVRSGLPRAVAMQLAAQTVKGAADMVLQTGKHPGLLKDGVTSAGGTTIAGIEALEKGGLRSATISAVRAATKRSMQLGGVSAEDIENKYGL
mmetsp:Transcript_4095/g.8673  ORF Transcript_4095/g.8673 Transcript_4095/m.8673 type:complete len:296 (-) Transcript_4095:263-1150(-)|eukprot:CAMPEP_0183314012 /NCGR_PEP_ID=MMETSP0160_2-20130417/47206_1 /TAXON_ID=2839 ORGANISM="Odontella Sinensis, Strain Grunow 1884" /NCGR_SAMPLE_ID=MMETSP0160_2 /ASSEMBLY_ACC=CAM_ASM_000250 /LENGTH=295 /DNA_ID=CAMNT_0025479231 /DNA_START=83 /DNA_END=970 /DNA_ORIENTATION=-